MPDILAAIIAFALIMGIWIGVQALARRQLQCRRDQDMLEGHSCGACDHSGACHKTQH